MKKLTLTFLSMLLFTACAQVPDQPVDEPADEPAAQQPAYQTTAIMTTNHGEITIGLYDEKAPETAKNFIELSKAGKYDGVIFHRVIKDFMIQTGDFENANGTGGHSYKGPGTYLKDEFGEGLAHDYGTLSMANSGPNSGGSQFFIVQAKDGTPWLDGKHAIFGRVIEGMDVVEKIAAVETGFQDKPTEDVVIEKVEIMAQ